MAVVRVLSLYVARVIVANPRVKTDKIDALFWPSLRAADFLPEIWLPDDWLRRSAAHARYQRPAPHGRNWLSRQPLPDDELMAIERHFRELDRLGEDLGMLDRKIAQAVIGNPAVKRLLTVSSGTMCMKLRSERPK